MTHHEDRRLAAWLSDSFDAAPVAALEEAFARARLTQQRPAWMVNLTGGTIAHRPASGQLRFSLVLAVVALVGLLAGAVIAGGVLRPKPAPPLIIASASPEPTAQPKPRMYAFMGEDGLWVANLDGTEAHAVAAGLGGCQGDPAWSPDGTRLLFSQMQCGVWTNLGDATTRLYLTDASGSAPQLVDTGCVSPCLSDSHGVFSSDGQHILFIRMNRLPVPPSATPDPVTGKPAQATDVRVLATLDLSTGRVTELGDFDVCANCGSPWPRSFPSWSPDRTQIVFNHETPPTSPSDQTGSQVVVLVADADGGNVQQVSPSGWSSLSAGWSPDGTRILFQGIQYTVVGPYELSASSDIYTVRPDGTDLRRLTTDENSSNAAWSIDGRIFFVRNTDAGSPYWVMDADGSHAVQLSGPPPLQELADTASQPTP